MKINRIQLSQRTVMVFGLSWLVLLPLAHSQTSRTQQSANLSDTVSSTITVGYTLNADEITIKVSDGGKIYQVTDKISNPEYQIDEVSKRAVLGFTNRLLRDSSFPVEGKEDADMWQNLIQYLSQKTEEEVIQVGSVAFHLKPSSTTSAQKNIEVEALERQTLELQQQSLSDRMASTQAQKDVEQLKIEVGALQTQNLKLQQQSPSSLTLITGIMGVAGGILAGFWVSLFTWPFIKNRIANSDRDKEADQLDSKIRAALRAFEERQAGQSQVVMEAEISRKIKEAQQEESQEFQALQKELSNLLSRINQLPNLKTIDSKWRVLGEKIRQQEEEINQLKQQLNMAVSTSNIDFSTSDES